MLGIFASRSEQETSSVIESRSLKPAGPLTNCTVFQIERCSIQQVEISQHEEIISEKILELGDPEDAGLAFKRKNKVNTIN